MFPTIKLQYLKKKQQQKFELYVMLILLSNRTLFNIKVLLIMHGGEKTKDAIGRLKTRHRGLMWSYLSEKRFSGSFL